MEDFQFILYIIFFVIYLVSRVLKGNKKQKKPSRPQRAPRPQRQSQPSPIPVEEEEKPMTFQDILKEIGKGIEKEINPQPETQKEPEVYGESVFTHEIDDEITQTYEQSIQEAQTYQTIDEAVDLSDTKYGRLEVYKIDEEDEEDEYLQDLFKDFSNPETAKKAIIYKEVFDRKYFQI